MFLLSEQDCASKIFPLPGDLIPLAILEVQKLHYSWSCELNFIWLDFDREFCTLGGVESDEFLMFVYSINMSGAILWVYYKSLWHKMWICLFDKWPVSISRMSLPGTGCHGILVSYLSILQTTLLSFYVLKKEHLIKADIGLEAWEFNLWHLWARCISH